MRYILNADDLGRTETVNKAIFECFDKGYISGTSVMVNMPCFDEATAYVHKHSLTDKVGLHINLTTGFPLTEDIKKLRTFTNEEGRFNSTVFESRRMMFFLTAKERKAVEKEISAQIEKYFAAGYTLLHADSHGHVHTFPSLKNITLGVLKKYRFISIRISRNIGLGKNKLKVLYKNITNKKYKKFSGATDYFASIKDAMNYPQDEDAVMEIMMHPNYLDGRFDTGEPIQADALIDFVKDKIIDHKTYIEEKIK